MHGVGRKDLGCPFGCRPAHRKLESARRSAAFYRSPEGKKRKQVLNQRRRKPPSLPEAKQDPEPVGAEAAATAEPWPQQLVDYVRIVVSLIEGCPMSREAILVMLAKVLRQHSMARRPRIDQVICELNKHPP